MSKDELIGKEGKNIISIPLPQIRIPRFRFSTKQYEGVGSGQGEVGDTFEDQEGQGVVPGAGREPGIHILEVDVTLEELAKILEEELQLPRIKPKGKDILEAEAGRYVSITRVGPESLRHFKRTFRESLKRLISMQLYNYDDPVIIPVREDKRYRARKSKLVRQNAAVIFFMMDVSGSMGDEQKEIVRLVAFWIDLWLRYHYRRINIHYIVHDVVATEIDQQTFYRIRESGGTKISSALELLNKIIKEKYPIEDWNIYAFHFSDGDNWGPEDNKYCFELLKNEILPVLNLFGYGQVKSSYGQGSFLEEMEEELSQVENLVTCEIHSKDEVLNAIKKFLGKGK
jgi:uncharacterized sporulation protein YeaH/YhbH (DUF444 family)